MDLERHQESKESKPEVCWNIRSSCAACPIGSISLSHHLTLSREVRQAFGRYGRVPRRGGLLGHHPRKYFDSGDFAVSAADRMKENSPVQTGKSHPLRETVSHPFSRVPSTGNVSADANEAAHMEKKQSSSKMVQSHLHNEIDDRDLKAGKCERSTEFNEDRNL
ncbi:uncharacterized protein BDW43DRAFT_313422 [Aspergillus alliaceus]|uniref:uncharacterized protein n=1 Tax=Petromyces alliaceus TaxID=209559 RepID=UPI0012A55B68|nr:uncharacterized protein BDW43DRAFT_313422 [Aspergillus alliaceus]KAB8231097.1 hypothetical protein BDW43DRAFT_313422 [Aspergillus alliaceus]